MPERVYWIPTETKGRLGIMPRPRGGDWLDDDIRFLGYEGVTLLVCLLTAAEQAELELRDEETSCRTHSIAYASLPIVDRNVPPLNTATVAALRALSQALEDGEHIVVHCRMGIGRAATIAASVLALQGSTPAQAFEVVAQARGYPVPDTPEQRAWVDTLLAYCGQQP